jgi:hypothetical protein
LRRLRRRYQLALSAWPLPTTTKHLHLLPLSRHPPQPNRRRPQYQARHLGRFHNNRRRHSNLASCINWAKWWGQSFGDFRTKMSNATDRLDDLRKDQSTKDAAAATQDALKGAAQAVVRLPSTRMFELHDKCQPAANGAADCPAAANNACRVKGFSTGKPMGISTSQVCSPQALLSGRSPTAADCHDDTYILGVVCQ